MLDVGGCISLRLNLASALSQKCVFTCCNDGAGTRGVLLADYPDEVSAMDLPRTLLRCGVLGNGKLRWGLVRVALEESDA